MIYWASGALFPDELPAYAHSPRQITGMVLMLIMLPPYFLAMSIVTQRRSLELVDQLEPLLPDPRHALEARAAIRHGVHKSWPAGVGIGLALGLLNTNPIHALTKSAVPAIEISISLGQLLMWLIIGLLLGHRWVAARSFSRLGEVITFDLFRLDRLRPLARSGTIDVLLIAGALALSPLQSLDAEFRWYNYRAALVVAIPAALFLLITPLRSVHRRISDEKQRQLARVDGLIAEADRSGSQAALQSFETLLAHRQRLHGQRTWPLSTALLSRLFVYLIIPPLAWVGAAVVEMIVTRLLGS